MMQLIIRHSYPRAAKCPRGKEERWPAGGIHGRGEPRGYRQVHPMDVDKTGYITMWLNSSTGLNWRQCGHRPRKRTASSLLDEMVMLTYFYRVRISRGIYMAKYYLPSQIRSASNIQTDEYDAHASILERMKCKLCDPLRPRVHLDDFRTKKSKKEIRFPRERWPLLHHHDHFAWLPREPALYRVPVQVPAVKTHIYYTSPHLCLDGPRSFRRLFAYPPLWRPSDAPGPNGSLTRLPSQRLNLALLVGNSCWPTMI